MWAESLANNSHRVFDLWCAKLENCISDTGLHRKNHIKIYQTISSYRSKKYFILSKNKQCMLSNRNTRIHIKIVNSARLEQGGLIPSSLVQIYKEIWANGQKIYISFPKWKKMNNRRIVLGVITYCPSDWGRTEMNFNIYMYIYIYIYQSKVLRIYI